METQLLFSIINISHIHVFSLLIFHISILNKASVFNHFSLIMTFSYHKRDLLAMSCSLVPVATNNKIKKSKPLIGALMKEN